ncbi:hypothetical protein G6F56_012443 [Rhizopus delemar]|nr:hypothetical protein G6F56_012443 [Rhizopus delemar]
MGTQDIVEDTVEAAKETPVEALKEPVKETEAEQVKETAKDAPVEALKETVKETQVEQVKEIQDSVESEKKPSESINDVSLSVESTPAILDPTDDNKENIPKTNRLASILPGVEESLKNVASTLDLKKSLEEQTQPPERSKRSREFEYSIEDPIDLDLYTRQQLEASSTGRSR